VVKANVLVDNDSNPVITDFGTSWQVSLSPHQYYTENVGEGTLRYSCPEVLSAKEKCTQPGDIFSFGSLALEVRKNLIYVIMQSFLPSTFKLATSKPPFYDVEDNLRIAYMITTGNIPERHKYQELPFQDGLWTILEQCWSFEKRDRPTSEVLVDKVSTALKNTATRQRLTEPSFQLRALYGQPRMKD
jgi:serine/threonine protein kinase